MRDQWKVLVIDDEMPAREMMKSIVDWETTDFKIVDALKNGEEALNFYQQNPVDLIITDIQMPIMNGLDLIRAIKKINPKQQFIILSCHEEFSYAQEAIRLGVRDYLIKDLISESEMLVSLSQIQSKLEQQRETETTDWEKQEMLKAMVDSSLYCNDWSFDDEKIMRHFNFDFEYKVVLVVWIDGLVQDRGDDYSGNISAASIIRTLKTYLEEADGEVFHTGGNEYVIVTKLNQVNSKMTFYNDCQLIGRSIRTVLREVIPNQLTIGISGGFTDIKSLKDHYRDAVNACKQRVFLGYGRNIFSSDLHTRNRQMQTDYIDQNLDKLEQYMLSDNKPKVKQAIESIYRVDLRGIMQYNYLKYVNMKLFAVYSDYIRNKGILLMDVTGTPFIPMSQLDDMQTIDEMMEFWCDLLDQLMVGEVPGGDREVYSFKVNQAINMIRHQYRTGVSLSDIAEGVEVHKVYLSRIFKQETGYTVNQYVQSLIMEDAKALLTTSNLKINEIAEQIGYRQSQQFTQTFKKMFGMTPNKYRKKNSQF